MTSSVDPSLANPTAHRHWHPVLVRFRDLDVLGHVNHGNLVGWLEDARVALELPIQPIDELRARPVIVVAELRIRFLEEVRMDEDVKVGTCILRLGRSSMTLGQAVFSGGRCVAIAELVEVLIGQESRKPLPWPAEYRGLLEQYLKP